MGIPQSAYPCGLVLLRKLLEIQNLADTFQEQFAIRVRVLLAEVEHVVVGPWW